MQFSIPLRFLIAVTCMHAIACPNTQAQDAPVPQPARVWKMANGSEIKGSIIGLKQNVVEFQTVDGKLTRIPLEKFAKEEGRAAVIERVGSGVVVVGCKDIVERPSFGSGFIIHRQGWILTNYHVVAGAADIEVEFRDAAKPIKAKLFSVDREHDIAVLQVTALPPGSHVVELQRKLPAQGADVWTIGHPNGLKNTVGRGDVGAVRKTIELPLALRRAAPGAPGDSQWIQTDAVLARGSSGGPLLNAQGQAIGINTLLAGPQLGFAVHVSHAQNAYLKALKAKPLPLPVAPGKHEDLNAWLSREVAPIFKAYSEESQKLQQAARGLPQQKVIEQFDAVREKYLALCVQLAKQQPDTWPGLQAVSFGLQLCDSTKQSETLGQFCDLALKHHADSSHIQGILRQVRQHTAREARVFCKQLETQSSSNSIRFAARASRVMSMLQWLNAPNSINLKEIKETRRQLTQLVDQFGQGIARDDEITDEIVEQTQRAIRNQFNSLRIGASADDIVGIDIEGKNFKLSDYKGKVVLLDFFTNWCPHCVKMYPYERRLHETMKDSPFALLGIHCESQQVLDKLVKDKVVTWRCWADGDRGRIAQQWKVTGFPTMVLVDHNGLVRWQASGAPTEAQLTPLIDQLVKEAQSN